MYFLIGEEIVIAFLVMLGKIQLDLPQIGPLLEKLSFYGKLLSLGDLSLPDHSHYASSLFQLLSELLKLLSAMSISAASLPDLPDFSPSEADIGIGIVGIGACLKLEVCQLKVAAIMYGQATDLETDCQGDIASF